MNDGVSRVASMETSKEAVALPPKYWPGVYWPPYSSFTPPTAFGALAKPLTTPPLTMTITTTMTMTTITMTNMRRRNKTKTIDCYNDDGSHTKQVDILSGAFPRSVMCTKVYGNLFLTFFTMNGIVPFPIIKIITSNNLKFELWNNMNMRMNMRMRMRMRITTMIREGPWGRIRIIVMHQGIWERPFDIVCVSYFWPCWALWDVGGGCGHDLLS
mmetsp:Transcript_29220/g.53470  ORF Transcript_29220/g.53470 Transcript_29220/m.53470 type:complete len:214 (+) Transcript_29220:280-921(+)